MTTAPPKVVKQGSLARAQAVQAEIASRLLARRRLLHFTTRMNPRYMAGWVHEDICRRLERFSEAVAAGSSPRLMLLMPPRHGKSELASKMFPAWHLGRHPEHEFIACSYNISLAMGFSKKIKALFDDPAYQSVFETRLDQENRSTEEWGLTAGGGYVAAGVGGGITGKGAHVLVIDDPIKNAEEADSSDTRDKLFDWYGSTAYTRLAPGGGVLVIQTWWHDDDLPKLFRIKRTIAARFWSALYQQNPVPADGAFFTKDQFRQRPAPQKSECNVQIAWDFAISIDRKNDYTVGTVGLQDNDDVLHVADVLRFKSNDTFFIVESILNLATRWYHPSLVVGFEDGQIWRTLEAVLKKRMRDRNVHFVIKVLKPLSDKEVRAAPLQARMQQGMVNFAPGDWMDVVRNELLRFPSGVHDDCVDSLAWLAHITLARTAPRKQKEKRLPSWRDRLKDIGREGRSAMSS